MKKYQVFRNDAGVLSGERTFDTKGNALAYAHELGAVGPGYAVAEGHIYDCVDAPHDDSVGIWLVELHGQRHP